MSRGNIFLPTDLYCLPHEALVPAATQRVVQQMTERAQRLAWPEVALGISQKRATVEQEILAPSCPF